MFLLSIFSGPQRQRPHPAAPAQLKETFSKFLEKYNSPSPPSANNAQKNPRQRIFNDFWDAPGHVWRPRIRHLEDAEIDAVLVSLVPSACLISLDVPCFSRAVVHR
jgi:small subunit ribosomal protein YMR-31